MPGYPIRGDEYFRTPIELFMALVKRSGRPRTRRREGQSDIDYYRAEIEAGTPEELARMFAGLPAADPPPPED